MRRWLIALAASFACSESGPSELADSRSNGGTDREPSEPTIVEAMVEYAEPPVPGRMAAGDGEIIQVRCILSSEVDLLEEPPALQASLDQSVLAFALEQPDTSERRASVLDFPVRVDARIHADGAYVPRLAVSIGETRFRELSFATPQIRVQTGAPSLLVNQEAIAFLRAPVGNDAAESLGSYQIPATQSFGALVPGDGLTDTPVIGADVFRFQDGRLIRRLHVSADPEGAQRLASATPDGDGNWPRRSLEFNVVDDSVSRLFVSAEDVTGARSPSIPIESTWYVASTAPGRSAFSPHQVFRSVTEDSAGTNPFEPSARQGVRAPDAAIATVTASGRYRLEDAGQWPSDAMSQAVWHEGRDAIVAYDASVRSRLIEFEGGRWLPVESEGAEGPPPLQATAIAYDSRRDRIVVFGGAEPSGRRHLRTWEWDGVEWFDRTGADSPRGDRSSALGYDPVRSQTVLVQPDSSSDGLLRVSTWNGTRWTVAGDFEDPPLAQDAPLVWDGRRERLVMVGGRDARKSLATIRSLWSWDGSSWTETSAVATQGPKDSGAQWTYDSARDRFVVFGAFGREDARTWEWDRTDGWTEFAASPSGPVSRWSHAMG